MQRVFSDTYIFKVILILGFKRKKYFYIDNKSVDLTATMINIEITEIKRSGNINILIKYLQKRK